MSNYSFNEVSLIGRVGKDPFIGGEGEKIVSEMSLATTDSWNDKEGQLREHTNWHSVVCFGPLAQTVRQYVKKGMLLHVVGKLRTSQWTDKEGNEHVKTQILVNHFGFLEKKSVETKSVDQA